MLATPSPARRAPCSDGCRPEELLSIRLRDEWKSAPAPIAAWLKKGQYFRARVEASHYATEGAELGESIDSFLEKGLSEGRIIGSLRYQQNDPDGPPSEMNPDLGRTIAYRLTLRLANGEVIQGVFKPARQPYANAPAEVACYHLSRVMGLPRVPPTVLRVVDIDGVLHLGSLQYFVENVSFARGRQGAWSPELQFFDSWVINEDRKFNILHTNSSLPNQERNFHDEEVWIDHGQAFNKVTDTIVALVPQSLLVRFQSLTETFLSDLLLKDGLSAKEIDLFLRRTRHIRFLSEHPEFKPTGSMGLAGPGTHAIPRPTRMRAWQALTDTTRTYSETSSEALQILTAR